MTDPTKELCELLEQLERFVIGPFRTELRWTRDRLRSNGPDGVRVVTTKLLEVRDLELRAERHKVEHLIQHLCRIEALIQGPDVVLPDGRRFKFHPPDDLVREAWEALSKAIIDTREVLRAGGERADD